MIDLEKFIIEKIWSDGYERIASIKLLNDDKIYIVHFVEYDEYVDSDAIIDKRKIGDILEGELSVELITAHKKTDEELFHRQPIAQSPHMEAVVQIKQIIDEYSADVASSICNNMLIEFEQSTEYSEGDFVYIEGELNITIGL